MKDKLIELAKISGKSSGSLLEKEKENTVDDIMVLYLTNKL